MSELLTMIAPAIIPGIWVFLTIMALVKVGSYYRQRLLRCPDSGTVTLVELTESSNDSPGKHAVTSYQVKNCQLWPGKKNCSRECLSRCSEYPGLFGFNLVALRPFTQELK